jgi:hypothetical protein
MSEHKFVVGQRVQFSPDWLLDKTTEGQYTIVRLFPKDGNLPQYRIKSERDGHERMVLEDRLDPLDGPATAKVRFAVAQRQALGRGKIEVSDA